MPAEQIFRLLASKSANPTTELEFTTDYQLLVAVVLSAQAQDKSVNLVTKQLFKQVRYPAQLLEFSEEQLSNQIKSIGLYRSKAKNLLSTARILQQKFNGKIPNNRKELESLPGIGPKSAAVLLNTIYKQPLIAVDTHVLRVSQRLGLVDTNNAIIAERQLYGIVPDWALRNAHHWLILHGRYICKAQRPLCDRCELSKHCPYFKQLNKNN